MIMSKFRKRMKLIFWIVVFGFVAWLVFEVGANILGIRIIKPWQRGILAEYKNGKITYNAFLTYYENVLRLYPQIPRKFEAPQGIIEVDIDGKKEYFSDISKPPRVENEASASEELLF